jgi:hypothetical protein
MIAIAVVVLSVVALSVAQNTKPNPPEDFHAKVGAYFHRKGRHDVGEG